MGVRISRWSRGCLALTVTLFFTTSISPSLHAQMPAAQNRNTSRRLESANDDVNRIFESPPPGRPIKLFSGRRLFPPIEAPRQGLVRPAKFQFQGVVLTGQLSASALERLWAPAYDACLIRLRAQPEWALLVSTYGCSGWSVHVATMRMRVLLSSAIHGLPYYTPREQR